MTNPPHLRTHTVTTGHSTVMPSRKRTYSKFAEQKDQSEQSNQSMFPGASGPSRW